MLGVSLGYSEGKVICYDEGTYLESSGCKMLCTIPGYVDGVKIGLDVGTEIGSLD